MSRRVIAGLREDGRSTVVADGQPHLGLHASSAGSLTRFDRPWNRGDPQPGESLVHEIWAEQAMPTARTDGGPAVETVGFDVAPGATKWIITHMGAATQAPMHQTATLDYGMIVSGAVTLLLETGDVTLAAGDAVVIAGVRHGWRAGPHGATLSTVLVGLPPSAAHQTIDVPAITQSPPTCAAADDQ